MIAAPEPAYDLSALLPGEIPLWNLVIAQFRLPEPTDHGVSHWLNVLRNGMELCRHHPANFPKTAQTPFFSRITAH